MGMKSIHKRCLLAAASMVSTGAANASGGMHAGDNPLIVGGAFGTISAFFVWVTADQFSRTPAENYKTARLLSGLILGALLILCIMVLFQGRSDPGFSLFIVFGYLFFALPNAAVVYHARKSAANWEMEEKNKSEARKINSVSQAAPAGVQGTAGADPDKPPRKRRTRSSAPKEAKEAGKTSDAQAVREPGTSTVAARAPRKNSAVELGVICSSLRYDEHEHGKQLSRLLGKARAEWVKSRNDSSSPHYARACKLLGEWFKIEYRISVGFSMSFGLNEDNEISRVTKVGEVKDSSEAVALAFSGEPQLKSFEVVSVDFRTHTSHHPLKDSDKLGFSPEVGVVAIYQVKPGRKIGSAQALQEFLEVAGGMVSSCFSVSIKDEAIETVEVDEDGNQFTSVSSSYSGGDLEIEVNVTAAKDFSDSLRNRVREAGRTSPLLGDEVPEYKRVLMLGQEDRLQIMLDEGLPVDTRVDDETLLKITLMLAATASTWFQNDELSADLTSRFRTVDDYCSTLKRMALLLLERGADVNVTGGSMSVLALAEMLKDPVILEICRTRSTSVDDANSLPLLLAAERGDADSLRELLDRGARVNKRFLQSGVTPLMMASQGPGGEDEPPLAGDQLARQEAAVRLLIERGARVDARSDRGDTAIGNAVRRGNASIVQILVDAGARTTEVLPEGHDLMEMARQRGHQPVLELLAAAAKGRTQSGPKRRGPIVRKTDA
jgi:Ankyrin repeats (many copies)